jgi:hypothetical protein
MPKKLEQLPTENNRFWPVAAGKIEVSQKQVGVSHEGKEFEKVWRKAATSAARED